MQGLSAYDPVTKQEVWIEDYSDEEQYLIYLLDQFSHSNLLWLLSPDAIWKRHKDQGIPLRKSTLRHLTALDDIDTMDDDQDGSITKQNTEKTIDNDKEEHPTTNTKGWCSCFDTKIHLKNIIKKSDYRTKNEVEFGYDDEGNIVYVAVANFEAHGVNEGVKRLKIRVCLWSLMYIAICLTAIIGVSTTIQLLSDVDYAFVPAIFCLMIGYQQLVLVLITYDFEQPMK